MARRAAQNTHNALARFAVIRGDRGDNHESKSNRRASGAKRVALTNTAALAVICISSAPVANSYATHDWIDLELDRNLTLAKSASASAFLGTNLLWHFRQYVSLY